MRQKWPKPGCWHWIAHVCSSKFSSSPVSFEVRSFATRVIELLHSFELYLPCLAVIQPPFQPLWRRLWSKSLENRWWSSRFQYQNPDMEKSWWRSLHQEMPWTLVEQTRITNQMHNTWYNIYVLDLFGPFPIHHPTFTIVHRPQEFVIRICMSETVIGMWNQSCPSFRGMKVQARRKTRNFANGAIPVKWWSKIVFFG